jgi:hypothetical protein
MGLISFLSPLFVPCRGAPFLLFIYSLTTFSLFFFFSFIFSPLDQPPHARKVNQNSQHMSEDGRQGRREGGKKGGREGGKEGGK